MSHTQPFPHDVTAAGSTASFVACSLKPRKTRRLFTRAPRLAPVASRTAIVTAPTHWDHGTGKSRTASAASRGSALARTLVVRAGAEGTKTSATTSTTSTAAGGDAGCYTSLETRVRSGALATALHLGEPLGRAPADWVDDMLARLMRANPKVGDARVQIASRLGVRGFFSPFHTPSSPSLRSVLSPYSARPPDGARVSISASALLGVSGLLAPHFLTSLTGDVRTTEVGSRVRASHVTTA